MAILYNEQAKTFTLQTAKSAYQMKVDDHGVLLHTYYGAPADESDFSYLIVPEDHGFSGQPGDVNERTYSMDYYPLEYAVYGNGDFRVSAMKAGRAGMVPALDLRYVSHKIYDGKYALPQLPAMFAGQESDVQTLEITLKDLHEEFYVSLFYGVFEKANVITRAAAAENRSDALMELGRMMSMSMDFMEGNLELLHFHGKHTGERQGDASCCTASRRSAADAERPVTSTIPS